MLLSTLERIIGFATVEGELGNFLMYSLQFRETPCHLSVHRLTVQFEDGEIFSRSLVLEGGPRYVNDRYELVLANPGNNMPIAGIIHDHEAGDVFYIVTKSKY